MKQINETDFSVIMQWIELYWNSNVDKSLQLVAGENIQKELTTRYGNVINIEYLRNFIESVIKLRGHASDGFIKNLLVQLGIEVISDYEGKEMKCC